LRWSPGAHRLQACIELGMQEIPVQEEEGSELDARLWEIDENLCRAELTELERSEHLAARKEVYEKLHPETRHVSERGGPGRGNKTDDNLSPVSFTADTAAKTGLSERSIQRDVQRAAKLAPAVRDEIRAMPIADKGVELDALARLTPEKQTEVVAAIKAGTVTSVRDATAAARRTEHAISVICEALDNLKDDKARR
jgi:ParB family chromosome partitioning protein